jgi:plasmid stabilization system protein ParE
MVAGRRKVIWSKEAQMQLKSAYLFILQESPINAQKVRADIVAVTRKLPSNPERYALDKYKLNNDGSYRAFEKHKYRIVYRIRENEIRILRIWHTKMNPLHY